MSDSSVPRDTFATFSAESNVAGSSTPKLLVRIGVWVLSGLIQLTEILSPSHSSAIAWTKLTMAAFVDEYRL